MSALVSCPDGPRYNWLLHPTPPTGKAFRHGDIENILAELAKTVGHAGGGGGLLGIAQSVFNAATSGGAGGATFTKEDIKRVYFVRFVHAERKEMQLKMCKGQLVAGLLAGTFCGHPPPHPPRFPD